MQWTIRRKQVKQPANLGTSIADPALTLLFGGNPDGKSLPVNEYSILGNSAFLRAISLISGTLAGLSLKSYTTGKQGEPEVVKSIFDDPDGPDGQTAFEWKQTLFIHRILHGSAFALKVKNTAGGLMRLPLIHPSMVSVEEPTLEEYSNPKKMPLGGKWFVVTMKDGSQKKYDANQIWECPSFSINGIQGLGLLQLSRKSISTTLAADRASLKFFQNGALISGMVTPESAEQDITDDLPKLRRELNNEMLGVDNAGGIAVVNRLLKFTPWVMTSKDAEFIASRQFQIEEAARLTGVPPHLLMQTEKQTSWGTGVDEQNRGLSKFVLNQWAMGFEQRASRLLANPRWVEFDFASLERPSAEKEIELLLKQTGKPFLTIAEARRIRNLPPLTPEQEKELGLATEPVPAPLKEETEEEMEVKEDDTTSKESE